MSESTLFIAIYYLFFTYICTTGSVAETPVTRTKLSNASPEEVKAALKFMNETDKKAAQLLHIIKKASFQYFTNKTTHNELIWFEAQNTFLEFHYEASKKANLLNWRIFETTHYYLYRWFKALLLYTSESIGSLKGLNGMIMQEIHGKARICPYKSSSKTNCSLVIDPDVKNIFRTSRNPAELRYYWYHSRDVKAKRMRNLFLKEANFQNKIARSKAIKFDNQVHYWMSRYETTTFLEDMEYLMDEVMLFYKHLHLYVKRKLMAFYKKAHILKNGPIPAHLLGHVNAKFWDKIFDVVNPFPFKDPMNATEIYMKHNMKPVQVYKIAEEFITSLGFEKMTPEFWKNSILTKPVDRSYSCDQEVYNMFDGKDYRLRTCALMNDDEMYKAVHMMGEIVYFMLYKDQPAIFQRSAIPGFKNAVGAAIASSLCPYCILEDKKFVDGYYNRDEWSNIQKLFRHALLTIPVIPYSYAIFRYRYDVYRGLVKPNELNKKYWEYKFEYQGLCPPKRRTEKDWDPGMISHITFSEEHMKYLVSTFLSFQIHQILCEAAGSTGPLYKCTIYKSKEAGGLLRKVLKLGASRPWQEVLGILIGNKTFGISPRPLLDYFEPLIIFLKKYNKGYDVDWKSKNVMVCPRRRSKLDKNDEDFEDDD